MNLASVIFAISTQRAIGWVLAVTIVGGMLLYWLFNWLAGKDEVGSEIELAANRKPQWGDELMETRRLDISLTAALGTLVIIAIALPLYWLGEPGRHEGAIEFREGQFAKNGGELYEENCAQCHGTVNGEGGQPEFSLVDDNGNFVAQVEWKAPSLGGVLSRYSYDEVRYVLDYGRQNSPMPAWGGLGGGPLTDQQVQNVILYIAKEQKTDVEIADGVLDGMRHLAEEKIFGDDADLKASYDAAQAALTAEKGKEEPNPTIVSQLEGDLKPFEDELDARVEDLLSDPVVRGDYLFNNPAASGAYGCARCHSAGWSYDRDSVDGLSKVVPGGGGLGPSLLGVTGNFDPNPGAPLESDEQTGFIVVGSREGVKYGNFGQGVGGGVMPAFGQCVADRDAGDYDPIKGHCEDRAGTLTTDQIDDIVQYERSLGMSGETS